MIAFKPHTLPTLALSLKSILEETTKAISLSPETVRAGEFLVLHLKTLSMNKQPWPPMMISGAVDALDKFETTWRAEAKVTANDRT